MQTLKDISLLLLALSTLIACGDDKAENKTKISISDNMGSTRLDAGGQDLDATTAPDAEVNDTDAGIENDAAAADEGMPDDMMLVDPDAAVQITTIADLEPEEWADFCNRLIALPQALNITDEDLQFGYCVGQYNEAHSDYFAVSPAECGAEIFDCIDALQDEHTLPLGICNDLNTAPENCAIEPVELDSCMRALLDAQQEMGTQDVCAPTVENAATFRTTFQSYQAANACLADLASSCPAL